MADEPRDKQYTYRLTTARHTQLKVLSAERGVDIQDIFDAALDASLGKQETAKPKPLREAHVLLDRLYENLDRGNYSVYWSTIQKLLSIVREDFSGN